jgi:nucleotide-binding universal stress UspA family protein
MRIVLAVDGSRPADLASELVAALPWREGGRVRIVSVAPSRSDVLGISGMAPVPPDGDRMEDDVLRIHRTALDAAEREIRCAHQDLAIETLLLRGRAGSIIVSEARDLPADLVVVGHRGRGTWESMLLGSVSAEVVDHAPCPVLVARDERIGPVIFADDGSPSARTAELALTHWPLFEGVAVTVVSVVEDASPYASAVAVGPYTYEESIGGYTDGIREQCREAQAVSEATAERLREVGFDATAAIRKGDAAQEIVACARERGAGIIVVGTRGMTGLRRLLLGSVARNVLHHAESSVLVVRDPAAGWPSPSASTTQRDLVSARR